jgi:anaerobic selenocysteine-containing dehydrogenase
MDRRNFFKIVSTVSAGVATNACGDKSNQLIPLLVADHAIPPGEERWHPSVCGECGAGCGTLVRVMEGERIVQRNGKPFREPIACIKKIEGNPLDPVSGGRLCARGHAALQSLYNPDRVQGPMRRLGARGEARFEPISWKEAFASASAKLAQVHSGDPSKILFLTTPQASARSLTIQKFLTGLGAGSPRTSSLAALDLERKAAELVFGWHGLPRYDLQNARFALGVGADFLAGWASPVYYGRQFGHFRQGRTDVRGRLVQAQSRLSITAASADEWLPLRPGSEPHFLLAIARLITDDQAAPHADRLPAAVLESLRKLDLAALTRACSIDEKRLRRVATELSQSEAPLVIAGVSSRHSNSLEALIAAHYLNILLGNIERPGGVFPPQAAAAEPPASAQWADALGEAQFVFLDGDNPVYQLPRSRSALANLQMVISFGNFIDDSAAFADLILPAHHSLESAAALIPAVSPVPAISLATPFVRPLYDTRPLEQILTELARPLNVTFEAVTPQSLVQSLVPPDQSWESAARQGGLWLTAPAPGGAPVPHPSPAPIAAGDPVFSGAPDQFPLLFEPYLSLQFHDGSGANLPWMQELPDPVSSAMWDLPLEIDSHTATQLHIATGDWVRLESPHGSLEARAYVHPAALPGVVGMAIGAGHAHFGRYASGRGANPLSVLAPGATRVRLSRLEEHGGELIQFSPQDREQGPWGYR